MDHAPQLEPHTICRCGDPFCGGANQPRRPADYVARSPSGTFRNAAHRELLKIEAREQRRKRRLLARLRREEAKPCRN